MAKKYKREASTSADAGAYLTPNAFTDDENEKDKDLERLGYTVLDEDLDTSDIMHVRSIIRQEIARVFFDLYKKKSVWEK
jgi:hypothetical protein